MPEITNQPEGNTGLTLAGFVNQPIFMTIAEYEQATEQEVEGYLPVYFYQGPPT